MIFRMSGMRGDLLYSLAYIDYYPKEHHVLLITPNPNYVSWPGHPDASPLLSQKDIQDFKEFLAPYDIEVIDRAEATSRNITMDNIIDLDKFRERVDLYNGNIMFAFRIALGILPSNDFNINRSGWLKPTATTSSGKIVINRTMRYRNDSIDYKLLERVKDQCIFVGSDKEYDDFCNTQFVVERKICNSIQEIFDEISACKAFVGNHSFIYVLAVSIAKLRFIEAYNPRIKDYTDNEFNNRLDADLIKTYLIG